MYEMHVLPSSTIATTEVDPLLNQAMGDPIQDPHVKPVSLGVICVFYHHKSSPWKSYTAMGISPIRGSCVKPQA